MLIDPTTSYDQSKIAYLLELREKIILHLAASFPPEKILMSLSKVGIIDIDENKKEVIFGASNDFMLTQAKKFFNKALKDAVQNCYNPQYGVNYMIYNGFSDEKNHLLIDLKSFLNIQSPKKEKKSDSHVSSPLNPSIKNELNQYFGILFLPEYRFNTFVAGATNQMAFAAAKAVATAPWTAYNPLFLYGNVGLGKTHLMQAVGNEIMQNFPDKVVIYLPATKLIEEIVTALRSNKMDAFHKKMATIDVLLIDDVQFLAGKDRTQEVLHDIFNDFHMRKKQIILSSDRPPKELSQIEPRLKSRFWLGLVVDIKAPDFETRIAILQEKLQVKGMQIEFEYLSLIAQYVTSNVRELEWALNLLLTRQQLSGQEISHQDVLDTLTTLGFAVDPSTPNVENLLKQNKKSTKNFDTLVEIVAEYYNIAIADLKSDSRRKEITTARQLLMYIAKQHFNWTLEKIGDYFGGKDHATAIYAIKNITKKLKLDTQIQHDYRVFEDRIS